MATKRRGQRRITQVRVHPQDLRISDEFIEAMREYGVKKETLAAAERRNARLAREARTAAAS